MAQMLTVVLMALLISYISTPLIRKLAFKIKAVDRPNSRKVHSGLMPRLGGLAVYLGFAATVLATQTLTKPVVGLLAGGTMIVLVGILDDTFGLSARVKLLGQMIAASALIPFGIEVSYITNPLADGILMLGYFSIPVTIFWVVAVTNAVNLIDGLDGLASGVSVIAALTLAVVSWTEGQMAVVYCALILAGAAAGFLKHNFNPAKIFLGDTGSMFLGYTLSTLAIMGLTKGATVISLFIPLVILGIPLLDTGFAIVRRLINRQPIFEADKEHLHHCLLALGLSHKQTVLVIYSINLILGLTAILLTLITTKQAFFVLLILSVVGFVCATQVGIIGTGVIGKKAADKKAVGKGINDIHYNHKNTHGM